jgi:hypothetical protein
MALYNGAIGLRLRCSQLCPELDDLLAHDLDCVDPSRVFFIYASKLVVQLGNVRWRDVERGGDRSVLRRGWELDLHERGLKVRCVRFKSLGEFPDLLEALAVHFAD